MKTSWKIKTELNRRVGKRRSTHIHVVVHDERVVVSLEY